MKEGTENQLEVLENIYQLTDELERSGPGSGPLMDDEIELKQLKDRFISLASHEFRTPLGGILTSASLLKHYVESEKKEDSLRHIQIIKKLVGNLTEMLDEFLTIERIERRIIRPDREAIPLKETMDLIVKRCLKASDKDQHIEISHDDAGMVFHNNRMAFCSVIEILLSNAIKYSPVGSGINIDTRVEKGDLLIHVKDHGIGIPKNEQRHIFRPFYRASNISVIQGTGLGLNICKRYLGVMGGIISFESKENEGTKFTVRLALER